MRAYVLRQRLRLLAVDRLEDINARSAEVDA
jgi:hypothetical protein